MTTVRVKFYNGRSADIEHAVDWDDDGHRVEPHLFVYGESGRVLASWPYADVASIEILSTNTTIDQEPNWVIPA